MAEITHTVNALTDADLFISNTIPISPKYAPSSKYAIGV